MKAGHSMETTIQDGQQKLHEGKPTIVFFDQEKHTTMLRLLGNTAYTQQLRNPYFAEVDRLLEKHEGKHHGSHQGDSMLLVFVSRMQAIEFAKELQLRLNDDANPIECADSQGQTHRVVIRMGIHTAIQEMQDDGKGDYGAHDDINFAARVMSAGVGGQILLSEETHCGIDAKHYECKAHRGRRIKDWDEKPQTIYELVYDGKERAVPGSQYVPQWYGEDSKYIERPEMEEKVLRHFGKTADGRQLMRAVVLRGYGGMGKTRLALEAAMKVVPMFEDKIWVAKLDEPPQSVDNREALLLGYMTEQIGMAFGIVGAEAQPEPLLARLHGRTGLLILDNYESVGCPAVQAWLRKLIQECRELYVLITTRQEVGNIGHAQNVTMEFLSNGEAQELLVDRVKLKLGQEWQPTDNDKTAMREIVGLTEGIPLAIELAGAWAELCSLTEIAEGIGQKPLSDFSEVPPDHVFGNGEPRHQALSRSLDWSFHLLAKDAQEVFPLLGLFGGWFRANTVQQIFGVSSSAMPFHRLLQASLLQKRMGADEATEYKLLRPTQDYALELLAHQPDSAARYEQYIVHYLVFAVKYGKESDNYNEEALDILVSEHHNLMNAINLAIITKNNEFVLDFYEVLRLCFWRYFGNAETEFLHLVAVAISRKILVADHPVIAEYLNNLAKVYEEQERYDEAEPLYLEALQIIRKRFSEPDPRLAIPVGNLAQFYKNQKRYVEATLLMIEALEIYRKIIPPHNNYLTFHLHILAELYQVQSQFDKAESLYLEALTLDRGKLSENHPTISFRLHALAELYQAQGHYDKAEPLMVEALALDRKLLPHYHPEYEVHLNTLGEIYRIQARYDEAEALFIEALQFYKLKFGADHPYIDEFQADMQKFYQEWDAHKLNSS